MSARATLLLLLALVAPPGVVSGAVPGAPPVAARGAARAASDDALASSAAAAQAALLALQDRDGGWALHEPRTATAERRAATLAADRLAATRAALAALERAPDAAASAELLRARARARAWLDARPPAPHLAPHLAPPEPVARVEAALARLAAGGSRLPEDALLDELDRAFRNRHAAARAAARAPRLRAELGLAELQLTEALSRALELLPAAHASRYRGRLRDEALAALDADGRARDPRRARGVSSLATARALLVLRRVAAVRG